MILLRQKTYARRDYAGLDEKAQNELRSIRNAQAQKLRAQRNKIWDRVNVQQENINKAHEFLANPGATWATPEYERALNGLPGGVREQANQMISGKNKTVLEAELKRDWGQRYKKALESSADDMGFERESLLKDTERRAQQAQQQAAAGQNAHQAATNQSKASAAQQAKKSSGGFVSKNWGRVKRLYTGKSKYGRAGQVGAIGATALGVGALGYGAYRAINKNKNKNQNISG